MNPLLDNYQEFADRFDVVISTGWGMTEIGFPMAVVHPEVSGTCGRINPLYEARIVDEEDHVLPVGEAGELIIRAKFPWMMIDHYLNRWEDTGKAWRNGWFHTGDVLRSDSDGNYFFVDRVADYLRVKGENVSSHEVEQEVLKHPAVQECACVAVKPEESASGVDSQTGRVSIDDEIKVVVVLRPQADFDPNDLLSMLSAQMPKHRIPRYIEVANELPRTPTGKIRKALLRDGVHKAWDRIAMVRQ